MTTSSFLDAVVVCAAFSVGWRVELILVSGTLVSTISAITRSVRVSVTFLTGTVLISGGCVVSGPVDSTVSSDLGFLVNVNSRTGCVTVSAS